VDELLADRIVAPYRDVVRSTPERPAPRRTPQSLVMPALRRVIPGVGRVHAQVVPFAQSWQAANALALQQKGPLWVALGDSMSQGIGARDIDGGWVGQLHRQLADDAMSYRLVNLSVTGARVQDVIDTQLAQLAAIGVVPDLVTVLIGANDMLVRRRRVAAVVAFGALLTELPPGRTVIATMPRRNAEALEINALIDAAAAAGNVRVAELRGGVRLRGIRATLADDYFHPNELGYARIAAAFAAAIANPGAG
jgi:lysophospholipase L1-like esterase